ncbi:MAG: phosphoribosylformylglycinamidine synthase I [Candidatus Omnitrophota bacterium]|jgi:phosphoribosylformylglycinamidine synthase|nr:MAG: phosphoribosylformylglycinamidine synthase I [Candidatus Omnitrophota bacterium]
MQKPKVCVLRSAGTNCDLETAAAFGKAGAVCELVHINELIAGSRSLHSFQILAIPGGFTYGDDLGAGRVFANELRFKLRKDIENFISEGKVIIGICNGFQILVKSGLLAGAKDFKQQASLIINDSAKFEDRWVYLKPSAISRQLSAKCVWTRNLPDKIYLPVAHGEGKFITRDKNVLDNLFKSGQVVLQYCDEDTQLADYPYNPNGSIENIAGICDETGRIFGLMPHPERHIDLLQHPRSWTENAAGVKEGDGLQIFRNGVEYIINELRKGKFE